MMARWLFAICAVLLACVAALMLDANRGLSTPSHLPHLVEPAGSAHIESMALQRDDPPPPAASEGFEPLPYFPDAPFSWSPDTDRQARFSFRTKAGIGDHARSFMAISTSWI
jgi:hypothetical protein